MNVILINFIFMKKIYFFFVSIVLFISQTYAFELNSDQAQKLDQIKWTLHQDILKKGRSYYSKQLQKISKELENSNLSPDQKYMYEQIQLELQNIFQTYFSYKEEAPLTQENLQTIPESLPVPSPEEKTFLYKTEFFAENGKNMLGEWLPGRCFEHYDIVKTLAQKHNFPPQLVVAMWKIEWGCHMSNPKNGWGPFQITSQYYKPWKIGVGEFQDAVEKFIIFSKNKMSKFNASKKHQQKLGISQVSLSYEGYTIQDIRVYSALYNGITSNGALKTSKFINGNLNKNLAASTDGTLTNFLKVLQWEISQKK